MKFNWIDHIDLDQLERNVEDVAINASSVRKAINDPFIFEIRKIEDKVTAQIRKTCHEWVTDCCQADPDKIRRIADFTGTVEMEVRSIFQSIVNNILDAKAEQK